MVHKKVTKIENVIEVKKAIHAIGGKNAGVVINKIPVSSKKYNDRYYYYGASYDSRFITPNEKKKRFGADNNHKSSKAKNKKDIEQQNMKNIESINQDEEDIKLKNIEAMEKEIETEEINQYRTENENSVDAGVNVDQTQNILKQVQNYIETEKDKMYDDEKKNIQNGEQ